MRLIKFKIKNFRGYAKETSIDFDDLTVFIGKNDVGKSTILEALDIFFNDGKGTIKFDKSDLNINDRNNGDTETILTAEFADVPDSIVIDSSATTSLKDEYLLNENGNLEIVKRYINGGAEKVYIKAIHPSNSECAELLLKKNAELKKIIKDHNIECANQTINSVLRKAIWTSFSDSLNLKSAEIDASKEDAKKIWEKILCYLPIYSLFQSDRKNSDSDDEVQDPLKEAVKEILHNTAIQETLSGVAEEVREKLQDVATNTLQKLKELDPDIADSLSPVIPDVQSLKWQDVFKAVSISGDEDIPINKRGSGVKRLVLLSFFRGEVERRLKSGSNTGVIYAIEEPETSQHEENQRKIVDAFIKLSGMPNVQVILTTHSAYVVKQLQYNNLRLILDEQNSKTVRNVSPGQLRYPSLNEVNYIAFNEATEEYHDELYAYIEFQNWKNEFINGKPTRRYIRQCKGNEIKEEQKVLTEYIRHQIHHPENTLNPRYTHEELRQSIDEMRDFIQSMGEMPPEPYEN